MVNNVRDNNIIIKLNILYITLFNLIYIYKNVYF